MPKGIKKSVKILIISASAIILLLASPFILLQFNKIQNFVVDSLTRELSISLNTRIEIGNVDYHFFNKLKIEDVYIEDQQQDTLLQIDRIYAGFNFWRLLRKKIVFSNLELDHFYANLKTDAGGKSNFDFLFSKQKPKQDSTYIDLKLEKLIISDSRISFTRTADSISFQHFKESSIKINDISADISINTLTNDTINAAVNYLTAREQSGFTLKNLNAKIIGTPQNIHFPTFSVNLPESEINLDNLILRFDTLQGNQTLAERLNVNIPVDNAQISLADLGAFVPELKNIHETVSVNARISGRLSSLRSHDIRIAYGKTVQMDAALDINGLPNIQESFIYAQINKLQQSLLELHQAPICAAFDFSLLIGDAQHRHAVHQNLEMTPFIHDLR